MEQRIVVLPAFGREYENVKDFMEGWDAGHEFKCTRKGFYISKSEVDSLQQAGFTGLVVYLPNLKVSITVW